MKSTPIAVFDSGLGGLSVLRALKHQMPAEHFLYFGDSLHAPYGSRPTQEIRDLTLQAASALFAQGAKALVIACNTATAAAIDALRAAYPDRIIIGIEPALKLAVQRHAHGCIAVMATAATLSEQKFATLMERCATDCRILKCPCSDLVAYVERGELTGPALAAALRHDLAPCFDTRPDAIVLGCTHFPFLRAAIVRVLGAGIDLLDGAEGTAHETMRRLQEAGLLCLEGTGQVHITNSLNTPEILELSAHLLNAQLP